MLETKPSAFPYTHLDNVVAVKGAMRRMSAHSQREICKGFDFL